MGKVVSLSARAKTWVRRAFLSSLDRRSAEALNPQESRVIAETSLLTGELWTGESNSSRRVQLLAFHFGPKLVGEAERVLGETKLVVEGSSLHQSRQQRTAILMIFEPGAEAQGIRSYSQNKLLGPQTAHRRAELRCEAGEDVDLGTCFGPNSGSFEIHRLGFTTFERGEPAALLLCLRSR